MKNKIKLITYLFLALLFLNNCGYQALYSAKGQKFSFGDIEISGEKKLKKYFEAQLNRFQNDEGNKFDLVVNVDISKNTVSKDKKGNPSIFSLSISAKIDFFEKNILIKSNTFFESSSYNNQENKFDLKQFEKRLERKLLDKIVDDIIIYTQKI